MTGGEGGGVGGQQQQGTGSQGAGVVPAQGGNAPVPQQQPVVNPQTQGEQSQEGEQSQSQEGQQEQGGDALTVLTQQQQPGANEQTNGQQGEEGQERKEQGEQQQRAQSQKEDQSQSQNGQQEQGGDALTVLAQQQQPGVNEQTNGQQGEEQVQRVELQKGEQSQSQDEQQEEGDLQRKGGNHQGGKGESESQEQPKALEPQQQEGGQEEDPVDTAKGKEKKEHIDGNNILADNLPVAYKSDAEVVNKSTTETNDVLEVQSTGVKEATNYAGLVYYEEKGAEDLITFTAAKKLDALLEFIEKKHPKAKLDLNVYFRIASPDGFIELKFDAPQDEPFTGWSIKPRMKPCRLYQDYINSFGDKDYPLPPSCPISVYGLPDAVPTLNYSVPLEGVVHSVTLYIHASLKTNPSTSSSSPNTVTESNAVSSTGGASASATVDVDQVKKVINSVLVSQFAALSSLPKEAIPKLANELYAVHLINSAVRDNPSVEKFIDEFKASLTFMAEMSDVQEHCLKFLNSFLAVSGSFAIAAKFLYQKWIEAIKTELGIDFIININF